MVRITIMTGTAWARTFTFGFRSRSRNIQLFAMTGLDWLHRTLLDLG